MIITITPEEVIEAKKQTAILDSTKKWNKFKCSTNYIGVLGEIVLHRYLNEQCVKHEWIQFNREGKSWNEPDFILNGKTLDLKTTYSDSMWFQKPVHDAYIYAKIAPDDSFLRIRGFLTQQGMVRAIKTGVAKTVKRGNRQDYVVSATDMMNINMLIGGTQ